MVAGLAAIPEPTRNLSELYEAKMASSNGAADPQET